MKKTTYIIMAIPFILTGCLGYQAVYKQPEVYREVAVGTVQMTDAQRLAGERRVAQQVRWRLEEFYQGHINEAEYTFDVFIKEETTTLAVRRDASDQRLQLTLQAEVKIRGADAKEQTFSVVTSSAAYNVEDTPYGTESGRERAQLRSTGAVG